jgi:hypothetical protein
MQQYVVQPGDSPAKIAIQFAGCPKCAIDLVRANPHKKAVAYPNGFQTFSELAVGERLNLPDKWFDGTLDRLPKSYFAALAHADGKTPGSLGVVLSISAELLALANNAAAALAADPNYCTSVGQPGSAVNTAVHQFKVAWNASQTEQVPVNTGTYEAATATALGDIVGKAPAACGGGAPFNPSPAAPAKSGELSTGAIAGIGLVGAGAVAGIVYLATRKKKLGR